MMPPHQIQQELFNTSLEKIIVSHGTVFGQHYHTAEPCGGNWESMQAWCQCNFGNPSSVWDNFSSDNRWYVNSRRFWFRDEQDLLLFLMRWS